MDPPVGGDDGPPALISEGAYPHAIFSVCRKPIGQVDDPIALGAEQDIQGVGEIRG